MSNAEPTPDQAVTKAPGGPPAVRIACAAMLLIGLVLLGQIVVALAEVRTLDSTLARVAPTVGATAAEVAKFRSDQRSYALFFACVMFFFMVFMWFAVANSRRGRRSGQVLAIIYSIPLLFCSIVPFLPGSESRLQVAFDNTEPGWQVVLDYATFAVSPLAIVVIIAMLTPSARRYFSWLPPAPAGYMWAPAAVPWPFQEDKPREG